MNQLFRTLVVDDSAALRESLSSLVDAQAFLEVVGAAGDGREAIEKVDELAPDLVLMDVQMPGMNGLDATTEIRGRHPTVRVIVVTMHDSQILRDACQRAGADGFASKSGGSKGILEEIRRVLPLSYRA